MVSDISDPMADQMLSYRWTTLAFVLGFIIGPLLGGTSTFFDGQYSLLLPFMIGGFLTGINIIVVLKFLPESYSHYSKVIKKDNLFIKIKNILVDNVSVVRNHNLANLSISYGFIQFSFGLYFQSISLYFAVYLNYGSGKLSFFM
jgi:DHA1 family tetracycline resistance protein-like MFS transporter